MNEDENIYFRCSVCHNLELRKDIDFIHAFKLGEYYFCSVGCMKMFHLFMHWELIGGQPTRLFKS